MSEYAVSERMRRVHEIKERITGRREDEEDDDVDYFKRKRIQRDALQERSREAIQAAREREKTIRDNIGYSAWAEQKNKEKMENARKLELAAKTQLQTEMDIKKAERSARKEEIRAISERSAELDDMKSKWLQEDIARSKARAEDEKYRREVQWARQQTRNDATKREREKFREERRLRDESNAVHKHARDSEWNFHQQQEPLDIQAWAKIQELRKREHDRRLVRAALNVEKPLEDPYAELTFRETSRRKKNWESYQKRLHEDENEMEKMKKWYTDQSLDRADRKREAIREVHSRPIRKY